MAEYVSSARLSAAGTYVGSAGVGLSAKLAAIPGAGPNAAAGIAALGGGTVAIRGPRSPPVAAVSSAAFAFVEGTAAGGVGGLTAFSAATCAVGLTAWGGSSAELAAGLGLSAVVDARRRRGVVEGRAGGRPKGRSPLRRVETNAAMRE